MQIYKIFSTWKEINRLILTTQSYFSNKGCGHVIGEPLKGDGLDDGGAGEPPSSELGVLGVVLIDFVVQHNRKEYRLWCKGTT